MKNPISPSYRQLFKDSQFPKLWLSQLLSQLTINLVNFSILTRIFEVTKSSVAVSLLWVAYSIPVIIGPFAGTIVDQFSRRKLMIVTNFFQAVTVFLYLFVPAEKIFTLYVLVFFYSLLDQIYVPSQQASLPWLVPAAHLPLANSLFLITQQFSLLIGFGLGGIFLFLIGRDNTTILASFFLVLATVSVYLLPKDAPKRLGFTADLNHIWKDVLAGADFLKNHREVLFPLGLIVFTQMFVTVIAVVLPSYTHQVLNLNLYHASVVLIVPGTLGALLFTYLLPKFKIARKKYLIEVGLLLASLTMLGLASLSYFGSFKIIFVILIAVCLGISLAAINVPSQTLMQEKTPGWFQGRVYSWLGLSIMLFTIVPLLTLAAITDALGVAPMFILISIILFIGFYLFKRHGDYVLANGIRF